MGSFAHVTQPLAPNCTVWAGNAARSMMPPTAARSSSLRAITSGRVLHLGTYNGNPLCMAAARTVLADVCTPDETVETIARNTRLVEACRATIVAAALPAHTVQFGAKGCVTWSETPVRNYRDYTATDFDLAFAQWIHGINRGVMLPPGLDEQWLVSVLHTERDAQHYAAVFQEFVDELVA